MKDIFNVILDNIEDEKAKFIFKYMRTMGTIEGLGARLELGEDQLSFMLMVEANRDMLKLMDDYAAMDAEFKEMLGEFSEQHEKIKSVVGYKEEDING